MKKLALGLALTGMFVWQANAIVAYDFTYSDAQGNAANGLLTGTLNIDGSVTVSGGSLTGTAGAFNGVFAYLYPTPGANYGNPASVGSFVVDNILYPNAPLSSTYVNLIDQWGLVFNQGGNIYSIWAGSQAGNDGSQFIPGEYSIQNGFTGQGTFTLTAVPEAGSFAVAGIALLGLVYVGRAYMQKLKLA